MKMTVASVWGVQVLCYFIAISVVAYTSYSVRKDWNEFFHITSVLFILFGGRWIGDVLADFLIKYFGVKLPEKGRFAIKYFRIKIEGFDGNGLDDFKGKKIISLKFPESQFQKGGILHLEVCWESGESWRISSKPVSADSDLGETSVFFYRKNKARVGRCRVRDENIGAC